MSAPNQTSVPAQNDVAPIQAAVSPQNPFSFLDLQAQFATIQDEVMAAINDVMRDQHFILGAQVQGLENELCSYIGTKHAVSCGSGSDALLLALLALRIGPGDEVITTPFTFIATAGAIARTGAMPVFVDICKETYNINPDLIRAAVTSRTRAIIPVHLFGLAADMDAILDIARETGLSVIEDAAQAIGSYYHDKSTGTMGTSGCFSFFPSKNLGCAGDGGLVTTSDDALADRLRLLRVHGSRTKYHYEVVGTNSRLDALQAAILRVKLKHLPKWTRARQRNADYYRTLFSQNNLTPQIEFPSVPKGYLHVYNQFVIRCQRRDELQRFLKRCEIPTEIYYPLSLHLQPAFSYLNYQPGDLPEAEAASREVLALPIYPELKPQQQVFVVRAIAEFYRQNI